MSTDITPAVSAAAPAVAPETPAPATDPRKLTMAQWVKRGFCASDYPKEWLDPSPVTPQSRPGGTWSKNRVPGT